MGAAGSNVVAVARRVGSLWKVHYETSGSQLGQFCPLGNIWQSLGTLGCHSCAGAREPTGIWWVEDKDVAKHPTMPRIASYNEELSKCQ